MTSSDPPLLSSSAFSPEIILIIWSATALTCELEAACVKQHTFFIQTGCGSTQSFLCVSSLLHAGAMLAYTKA